MTRPTKRRIRKIVRASARTAAVARALPMSANQAIGPVLLLLVLILVLAVQGAN